MGLLRGSQEKYKKSEVLPSFSGSDLGIWSEGNALFLCAHPTGSLNSKTERTSKCLRCPLLPGWDQILQSKEYIGVWQTRVQILALPLVSSVALDKLLNPCKILAAVYNVEIIIVPMSEGCFEDKMRWCIERELFQGPAHNMHPLIHSFSLFSQHLWSAYVCLLLC